MEKDNMSKIKATHKSGFLHAKLGFIGEKLQRKNMFFFEKKNQKAFWELRE